MLKWTSSFIFITTLGFSHWSFANSINSQLIYRSTFEICQHAQIGATSRWQKVDLWMNQKLHEGDYPNNRNETYVAIGSKVFNSQLMEFFINAIEGKKVSDVVNDPKFAEALDDCFRHRVSPEHLAEVKRNFKEEYRSQWLVANMTVPSALVLGGLGAVSRVSLVHGARLASSGVEKAVGRGVQKVAQRNPKLGSQLDAIGNKVFPNGIKRAFAVGALSLMAVNYFAQLLHAYDLSKEMRQTRKALKEGKIKDDLTEAVATDFFRLVGEEAKNLSRAEIVQILSVNYQLLTDEWNEKISTLERLEEIYQNLDPLSADYNEDRLKAESYMATVQSAITRLQDRRMWIENLISKLKGAGEGFEEVLTDEINNASN